MIRAVCTWIVDQVTVKWGGVGIKVVGMGMGMDGWALWFGGWFRQVVRWVSRQRQRF